MIKPEFWDDEKLAKVSRDARLLFAGLWTYSDDYGVVKGSHVWLKSKIFPYDDSLKIGAFNGWMESLMENGFIIPFDADGEKYYYIRKFRSHQIINRPSQQRNPTPPQDILNGSVSNHGALTDETETETETETESETEVKPKPNSTCPAFQPDEQDVRLVQLLIDLMGKNNPDSSILKRLTPKRQSEWINQCRLLRTADKRTPEQIELIVRFSQDDAFWKSNILSMPKLREKWDQLVMKARQKTGAVGIYDWLKEREKNAE